MLPMARTIVAVLCDFLKLGALFLRPASAIRAENLVLRKQLTAYMGRGIPLAAPPSTRVPTRRTHAEVRADAGTT